MYRKLIISFILVFMNKIPAVQVTFLTILTLVNFIYTFVSRPYGDELTNRMECSNEVIIMICAYLMNTFMQSYDIDFSNKMSIVFIAASSLSVVVNVIVISYQIFVELWARFW